MTNLEICAYYIGTKQIFARPTQKNGVAGYAVIYPDGYESWSPKEAFEKAYIPMGHLYEPVKDDADVVGELDYKRPNQNRVTQEMVDGFIRKVAVQTIGEKTTIVQVTLINGYEIVEASSCVDKVNYSEEIGKQICLDRIKNKIWELLGFTLQWARGGIHNLPAVDPIQSNPIQS